VADGHDREIPIAAGRRWRRISHSRGRTTTRWHPRRRAARPHAGRRTAGTALGLVHDGDGGGVDVGGNDALAVGEGVDHVRAILACSMIQSILPLAGS